MFNPTKHESYMIALNMRTTDFFRRHGVRKRDGLLTMALKFVLNAEIYTNFGATVSNSVPSHSIFFIGYQQQLFKLVVLFEAFTNGIFHLWPKSFNGKTSF